jgi:hypothetical protein
VLRSNLRLCAGPVATAEEKAVLHLRSQRALKKALLGEGGAIPKALRGRGKAPATLDVLRAVDHGLFWTVDKDFRAFVPLARQRPGMIMRPPRALFRARATEPTERVCEVCLLVPC